MTGRIQKALSGFYYVNNGETILTCRARGKFRKEGISPLVGDQVEVRELGNGEGFVEKILPRRNAFSRPAVANIDQLVVIASAAIPKTDPFLIDRVAAIAALKDCRVVVVLNKCDLDRADALYEIYHAAGFPTLRLSAAFCLYRELRRRKIQHSECLGSRLSLTGGRGQYRLGKRPSHDAPCGTALPLLWGGGSGYTRFFFL